jgi:hypothetical protein
MMIQLVCYICVIVFVCNLIIMLCAVDVVEAKRRKMVDDNHNDDEAVVNRSRLVSSTDADTNVKVSLFSH